MPWHCCLSYWVTVTCMLDGGRCCSGSRQQAQNPHLLIASIWCSRNPHSAAAACYRAICSAIDKLDKAEWPEVRQEMVEDKGCASLKSTSFTALSSRVCSQNAHHSHVQHMLVVMLLYMTMLGILGEGHAPFMWRTMCKQAALLARLVVSAASMVR